MGCGAAVHSVQQKSRSGWLPSHRLLGEEDDERFSRAPVLLYFFFISLYFSPVFFILILASFSFLYLFRVRIAHWIER